MTTIIFDASPLITACKFKVKKLVIDHLLPACQIVITPSVEREVAILGARYPDGTAAGKRIARGDIQVVPVAERKWERPLAAYALGDGERESIELCAQKKERRLSSWMTIWLLSQPPAVSPES